MAEKYTVTIEAGIRGNHTSYQNADNAENAASSVLREQSRELELSDADSVLVTVSKDGKELLSKSGTIAEVRNYLLPTNAGV